MLLQNLKILAVVLLTLGLYTWVSNAIPQVRSEVPEELTFTGEVSEAQLIAAGSDLFSGAGGCTACHGLGTRAPNLLADEAGTGSIGQRCGERVPGQDCKDYLYASLTETGAFLVPGYDPIMVDQRINLSENQVWALVAYLQSQGGSVTVSGADLQATGSEDTSPAPSGGGATAASSSMDPVELFRGNMCFACHKLGDEGAQVGPPFDGMGGRLSAEEIRTSILDPRASASEGYEPLIGVMPANFGQVFTAAQLEAIVQYLTSRR